MNSKKENILIVDDNYEMLDLIQRHLKILHYAVYKASSVNEALDVLKHFEIDLLITDLSMPEINGIELVKYTEEHFPLMPKLVISGMPSIDNAVKAIKSGALDFLIKPFTNEELQKAIQNSIVKRKHDDSLTITKEISNYGGLIGNSQHSKEVIDLIKRVKNNKVNVLIEGESGTEKNLLPRRFTIRESWPICHLFL